jgi:hypothetical protein
LGMRTVRAAQKAATMEEWWNGGMASKVRWCDLSEQN